MTKFLLILRLPLFLSVIFATAVLASGFVESTRICGSLEIEQIYCFVPPCPQPLKLHYTEGLKPKVVMLSFKSEAERSKLEKLDPRQTHKVCVVGQFKTEKSTGAQFFETTKTEVQQ